MLRILGSILMVAIILGTAVAIFTYYRPATPCEETLTYGLGSFDERFNISKEAFLKTLAQAEAVWELPMGLDLLAYDPEAAFQLNLIFDERQERTLEELRLRKKLNTSGTSYESLLSEYTRLNKKHADLKAQYEPRLAKYNSDIGYWNSQGGAPDEEFEKLETERRYLESNRDYLNSLATQLNVLATRISKIAQTHNLTVTVYNEKFSLGRNFDQADYSSREQEINIYQFADLDELRLAMAHEFGHALGLDHVENPQAIMYYLMEKQDAKVPKLTDDDLNALRVKCNLPLGVSARSLKPDSTDSVVPVLQSTDELWKNFQHDLDVFLSRLPAQ